MPVEYYFLILIFLFVFIIGLLFFKYLRILKNKFEENEIAVMFYMINSITNQYKSTFFQENHRKLRKKYDIREDSPTKATGQFQKEYEQLLRDSTNEIVKSYFSDELKKKIFKYFTLDSLLLHIISSLRS